MKKILSYLLLFILMVSQLPINSLSAGASSDLKRKLSTQSKFEERQRPSFVQRTAAAVRRHWRLVAVAATATALGLVGGAIAYKKEVFPWQGDGAARGTEPAAQVPAAEPVAGVEVTGEGAPTEEIAKEVAQEPAAPVPAAERVAGVEVTGEGAPTEETPKELTQAPTFKITMDANSVQSQVFKNASGCVMQLPGKGQDYFNLVGQIASDPSVAYHIVCDGHGGGFFGPQKGAAVAKDVADRLHAKILQPEIDWSNEASVRQAIENGAEKMDATLAENSIPVGGTTAVFAFITPNRIYVGNVGDSRAVLSRGGVAVALSREHTSQHPEEGQRHSLLEKKLVNGALRMFSGMDLTRTFGNIGFKDEYKDYMISRPEVMFENRHASDEFIVLASDGLWDNMTSQEVIDWIREHGGDQPAEALTQFVRNQSPSLSGTPHKPDDIAVVVVRLK